MNIQEAIDNLSNSELLKLISILVTLTLAIGGVIARAIAIKWKHNLDSKIKKLEIQSSQNQTVLNAFSSTSNVSQTKRIQTIEHFWGLVLKIIDSIPSSGQLAYQILDEKKLNNFFNLKGSLSDTLESEVKLGISNYEFFEICKECDKLRPFLGEKIWINYQILQGFAGRSRVIFQQAVEERKLDFWMNDSFFTEVFFKQLTKQEMELIKSNRYSSYKYALEIVEQRLLSEINNILSGKRVTYDSVEIAKKLTEMNKSN